MLHTGLEPTWIMMEINVGFEVGKRVGVGQRLTLAQRFLDRIRFGLFYASSFCVSFVTSAEVLGFMLRPLRPTSPGGTVVTSLALLKTGAKPGVTASLRWRSWSAVFAS